MNWVLLALGFGLCMTGMWLARWESDRSRWTGWSGVLVGAGVGVCYSAGASA